MSRGFSSWTMKDIERLQNKGASIKETEGKKKHKPAVIPHDLMSNKIASALRSIGIECETEYRFSKDRRFRLDVAVLQHKIGIEFEGGTYINGDHNRAKGFIKDCKKYNLLTMHGWKLLRYASDITRKANWEYSIALDVKQLIEGL